MDMFSDVQIRWRSVVYETECIVPDSRQYACYTTQ